MLALGAEVRLFQSRLPGVAALHGSRPTVLILDRDLGFVFWLGHTLDQAGYDSFPAKNCEAATELLSRWNIRIDVLVIGSGSDCAAAFARNLRLSHPDLKVVAVVKEGESSCLLSEADAVHAKPGSPLDSPRAEWLRVIDDLLGK